MPGKVGMIAGIFFGLMFGLGGLGSAFFGWLADQDQHRIHLPDQHPAAPVGDNHGIPAEYRRQNDKHITDETMPNVIVLFEVTLKTDRMEDYLQTAATLKEELAGRWVYRLGTFREPCERQQTAQQIRMAGRAVRREMAELAPAPPRPKARTVGRFRRLQDNRSDTLALLHDSFERRSPGRFQPLL